MSRNSNIRTPTATTVPGIPSPPSDAPPALKAYLEALAEAVEIRLGRRGDPRDRAITLRELIASGLAQELRGRPYNPNATSNTLDFLDPDADLSVPPRPTGFSATGGYSLIQLYWDFPRYGNHSQTEIWRHDSDVIGDAQLVGVSPGLAYVDAVGEGSSYYYWIRHVSTSGVPGPFNDSAGTLAETALNVELLLGELTGAITESQLFSDLGARIDLIDAEGTGLVDKVDDLFTVFGSTQTAANSAAAAIQAKTDALLAQEGAETAASQAVTAKTDAETASAAASTSQTSASQSATSAQGSAASAATSASAAATSANQAGDSASAAATSASNANTYATDAGTAASSASTSATNASTSASQAATSASQASTSETNADSSAASAATSAGAAATSANQAGQSASAAAGSASTAATQASAAGQSASSANTSATNASTSAANALTYRNQASTSASTAEGYATAAAQDYTAVNARLDNAGGTGVTVEQKLTSTADSVDGLEGKYTVKVDANGYVAGFGLAVNANDATPTSEFIIRADRFSIASPGQTSVVPFIVQASATTINGVSVPAGVYMNDAYIRNGTITNAKIGTAAVDNAKIADASITTAKIGTAQIYEANIANGQITNAKIGNAAITNAKIGDAEITTAKIGTAAVDTLQLAGEAVIVPVADTFSGFISSNEAAGRTFPYYSTPTSGLPSAWITLTQTTEVLVLWGVRFQGQASNAGNMIIRIYESGSIIEDIGSSPAALSTGGFVAGAIRRSKPAGTYQYYMNWAAFNSALYEAYIIVLGIQR